RAPAFRLRPSTKAVRGYLRSFPAGSCPACAGCKGMWARERCCAGTPRLLSLRCRKRPSTSIPRKTPDGSRGMFGGERRLHRPRDAVDPAGTPVAIVLLLPYREAALDLVYDVAASLEGITPMRGRHAYPHSAFAYVELPHPVLAAHGDDRKTLQRFAQYALAFLDGDRLVRLVLEPDDGAPVVMVSYPALEADAGTRAFGGELHLQRLDRSVERLSWYACTYSRQMTSS